jgi:ribose 5-phosphate isomerase B
LILELLFAGGNGIAMTANKHPKVRAALCWMKEIASLARQHNDANIISIPARYTSIPQAVEMVETFINTAFEGGRHQNRVKNRLLDSFIFIKTIFHKK